MACALALSAKRFGVPTILLYDKIDNVNNGLFEQCIPLSELKTHNIDSPHSMWEYKKYAYQFCDSEYGTYIDADSLVVKDPHGMISYLDSNAIHMPMACEVNRFMCWGSPQNTRQLASNLGIPETNSIFTLNGGFILWKKDQQAQQWFSDFDYYLDKIDKPSRDELCMSLAFAKQNIVCGPTDTSIGVWDCPFHLDLPKQEFHCTKHGYWGGHYFEPHVIHFGGSNICGPYKKAVKSLGGNYEWTIF